MLDDVIRSGAEATLTWLGTKDPASSISSTSRTAAQSFPAVGRASVARRLRARARRSLEHGKPIGFATVTQLTIGVQVGGQTAQRTAHLFEQGCAGGLQEGQEDVHGQRLRRHREGRRKRDERLQRCQRKGLYARGGMLLEVSSAARASSTSSISTNPRRRRFGKGNGAPRVGGATGEEHHEEHEENEGPRRSTPKGHRRKMPRVGRSNFTRRESGHENGGRSASEGETAERPR